MYMFIKSRSKLTYLKSIVLLFISLTYKYLQIGNSITYKLTHLILNHLLISGQILLLTYSQQVLQRITK